ncbi:unnamed protein product [Bursaphelenchus okinawaensis]|uniref:Aldehyde dehydrogenase domain-containing protein n=1 Tax=Bursaphelenchus okinawaensis TaxID=465554 RepID=A0A811LU09_9BILA|nr:unnamed protein product [Bursaphelenchus okinawaensis]CAG9128029.1 unnamed protein product [Bursaphelenchus okinawaensis]
MEQFIAQASKLKVGNPKDCVIDLGALVSKPHYDKVASYISLVEQDGLAVHCGGPVRLQGPLSTGYYIAPTVISGASDESRLMKEEIFGPVVCVSAFDTADEVVKRVNSSEYGLSATVWSQSVDNLTTVAN